MRFYNTVGVRKSLRPERLIRPAGYDSSVRRRQLSNVIGARRARFGKKRVGWLINAMRTRDVFNRMHRVAYRGILDRNMDRNVYRVNWSKRLRKK